MIIKLLQDEMIDGKLRVKGEVCNTSVAPGNSVIIKEDKKTKERMKKVKEIKPKKNGKVK